MSLTTGEPNPAKTRNGSLPRLGFLGFGWIGRKRLEAVVRSGTAEIVAIADIREDFVSEAKALAPQARRGQSLDDLLECDLDGVVIATPSALHAPQTIKALERGLAVFCQKPLAPSGNETRLVVEAARKADRLLMADFCYRYISGVDEIRKLVLNGELGQVFSVNLVFHNAYGPDKQWFYQKDLSGGGCLIDLGIHLIDLALWILDYPEIRAATGRIFSGGEPVVKGTNQVEDFALGTLVLQSGAVVQLACSWKLHAGLDADIEASFYGSKGGASLTNVDGSFYRFKAERFRSTTREALGSGPEDDWSWGSRAVLEWADRIKYDRRFDPPAEHFVTVASVLDSLYDC